LTSPFLLAGYRLGLFFSDASCYRSLFIVFFDFRLTPFPPWAFFFSFPGKGSSFRVCFFLRAFRRREVFILFSPLVGDWLRPGSSLPCSSFSSFIIPHGVVVAVGFFFRSFFSLCVARGYLLVSLPLSESPRGPLFLGCSCLFRPFLFTSGSASLFLSLRPSGAFSLGPRGLLFLFVVDGSNFFFWCRLYACY